MSSSAVAGSIRTMVPGQMPAAFDDARDLEPVRERKAGHHQELLSVNGTAVTSERRK